MLKRPGDIPAAHSQAATTKLAQDPQSDTAGVPGSSPVHDHASRKQDFRPTSRYSPRQAKLFAKRYWFLAIPLVLAVIAGAFFFFKGSTSTPAGAGAKAPVVTVTVEPAGVRALHRTLTVNGSISAWDPLSIGSEITGLRIESVQTDEGHTVSRGQVLATLNSSVLRAQLRQAQANLKASEANYHKALQPNRPEDINGLRAVQAQASASIAQEEANLVHASASLTNARQNAERYEGLLRQGAVSQQETESRQMGLEVAQADLRNAKEKIKASKFVYEQAAQRLLMAERGGRTEDIQVSAANIEQMRADVSRLEAQIEQTVIRAPDDGLIVKRDARIGDIATATKSLFAMVRNGRLELRAQVPEVDLPQLRPGQVVTVIAHGAPNKPVSGRVREISPQVDSITRLGTARIDLPEKAGLLPGMFVDGQVDLGEQGSLAVPSKAVLSRNEQSFVFLLNGTSALQRPVITGGRTGEFTEITAGLRPGDQVIIAGAGFLKDGDPVRVAPAAVTGVSK